MATKLQNLLSPNQTGFLQQRSILHAFHYAQQVVQLAHKQKVQLAIFKADFFKAFDTLNWNFILNLLEARGFPPLWIKAVQNRILLGKSKIILNSVAGRNIILKRGVRQGDPISPYIFNLAMDFLTRWMQKLYNLNFLTPPFPNCMPCLLYADDTILFLKPTQTEIIRIKLLFHIFGAVSGLKLNMLKFELAITSAPLLLTQNIAAVIQCKAAKFPIKYLGLPLSQTGPQRADFLPIIERLQTALSGWKASLLSIGGRFVLTNAVLSSIPQYIMSIFILPKWVLHTIDRIRKRFLWHGHKDQQQQNKALYMVNWALATRPRKMGGLGLRDIKIANQTMLIKWMWQWLQSEGQQAWWKAPTTMAHASDRPWDDPNGTTFWKSIGRIQHHFNCSISFRIGNGNSTKFWHDNWLGTTLKWEFPNLYCHATNKQAAVSQCTSPDGWSLYFPNLTIAAQNEETRLHSYLQGVHLPLTQLHDEITWIRSSGTFSTKSAYLFLSQSPSPTSHLQNIWHIKPPQRVMIFAWLMLINRLPTIDNLARRGWLLPNMCTMCKAEEETTHHIFVHCSVAVQIRAYILTALPHKNPLPHKFVAATSTDMLTDPKESEYARRLELTTCFILWRERCRRIFSDKKHSYMELVREIRMELHNWFGV